ncbi:hypothetical protein AGIG_G18811 [Arapaima gigas]
MRALGGAASTPLPPLPPLTPLSDYTRMIFSSGTAVQHRAVQWDPLTPLWMSDPRVLLVGKRKHPEQLLLRLRLQEVGAPQGAGGGGASRLPEDSGCANLRDLDANSSS